MKNTNFDKQVYLHTVHNLLKVLRRSGISYIRAYSEPLKNGYRTKLWGSEDCKEVSYWANVCFPGCFKVTETIYVSPRGSIRSVVITANPKSFNNREKI